MKKALRDAGRVLLTLACTLAFIGAAKAAALRVANVFSDDMIVQRGAPILLWGFADDGAVSVRAELCDGTTCERTTGRVENGAWSVSFSAREASLAPFTITVTDGRETCTIHDVLAGDVWYVMGQSNAAYNFSTLADYEMLAFEIPPMPVRVLYAGKLSGDSREKRELREFADPDAHWTKPDDKRTADASALGVLFAYALERYAENNVPVGIVSLGFDGEELAAFLPEKQAKNFSGYGKKSRVFNAFLAPLANLPLKGVIWYQGEANAPYYTEYRRGLDTLIEDFRARKGKDVPFYVVELPPCFPPPDPEDELWQFVDYALVRGEAGCVPMDEPAVYICASSDLWSNRAYRNNLHPNNKRAVAERLAGMAAYAEWGMTPYEPLLAPTLAAVGNAGDDRTFLLTFSHTAGGLFWKDGIAAGFTGIGEKWESVPLTVTITSDDSVTVKGEAPLYHIRYGADVTAVFGDGMTLMNGGGIPAAAFNYEIKPIPLTFSGKLYVLRQYLVRFFFRGGWILAPAALVAFGLYMRARTKKKKVRKRKETARS